MNNVLITGVGGFLASHIAEHLVCMGYDVIGLDDLSGGFKSNIPEGVKFIKGDICNVKLIQKLFKKYSFKYVFHLAAYAAENLSHFIKLYNCQNNIYGSLNLINESVKAKVECFIYTSSIAVYGKGQVPYTEHLKPEPEDSYGIAKYAVEQELKITNKMFGLNYIIFRPYNIFGEKQNIADKYRNVIGIFMNQLMMDKPLTVFGDGFQQRSFTYIKNIVPLIAESTMNKDAYNQIFNIGSHESYTINYMIKVLLEIWNKKKHPIKYLEERQEVKIAHSSCSKLKSYFKYSTKHSLKDGLKEMAVWALSHGARQSKEFKNIEIRENLPEGWL